MSKPEFGAAVGVAEGLVSKERKRIDDLSAALNLGATAGLNELYVNLVVTSDGTVKKRYPYATFIGSVVDATTTIAPQPIDGVRYIVPAVVPQYADLANTIANPWFGNERKIAIGTGSGWVYYTSPTGSQEACLVTNGANAGFVYRFNTAWSISNRFQVASTSSAKTSSSTSYYVTTYGGQNILCYTNPTGVFSPLSHYFVSGILTAAPIQTGQPSATPAGFYIQVSGTPAAGALNDVIYWDGTTATLEFTYANAGNVVGVGSVSATRQVYYKNGSGSWALISPSGGGGGGGGGAASITVTASGTLTASNVIVNSSTRTEQTLSGTYLTGNRVRITNKGHGMANIIGSVDGSSSFSLVRNEFVELENIGGGNWIVVATTRRLRCKKLLTSTSGTIGVCFLDYDGNMWHMPGERYYSGGDGMAEKNQMLKRIYILSNPSLKALDTSKVVENTIYFHAVDNSLWGLGENEGGQLNQLSVTDATQFVNVHNNIVKYWVPLSPGSNGIRQNTLIALNTSGDLLYTGPDNQSQSGCGSATIRSTAINLAVGRPTSQSAFTRTVSTTAGSPTITITGAGQTTSILTAGQRVTGTNIPANSTVATIVNSTQFTINNNATATGTSITATFFGWVDATKIEEIFINDSYNGFSIFWFYNDGRKFYTGYNDQGIAGDGTISIIAQPREITNFWGRIGAEPTSDGLNWRLVKIVSGSSHFDGSTAYYNGSAMMWLKNIITNQHRVQTCGSDTYGAIGNGAAGNTSTPFLIASSIASDATAIAYKGIPLDIASQGGAVASMCVIMNNGVPYVWGFNSQFQLGIGNSTQQNSPVQQFELDGTTLITNAKRSLSCHFNSYNTQYEGPFFCERSNGDIYSNGFNSQSNCGIGSTANPITRPNKVIYDKDYYGNVVSMCAIGFERNRMSYIIHSESGHLLIHGRNFELQAYSILGTADKIIGVTTELFPMF